VRDHADPGPAVLDLDRRSDAVEAWHQEIHNDRVWLKAIYLGDRFSAISRLTNNLDRRVHSEYSGQRSTCAGAVVRDEYTTDAGLGAARVRHGCKCAQTLPVTTSDKW
jgi:hypothetical protein